MNLISCCFWVNIYHSFVERNLNTNLNWSRKIEFILISLIWFIIKLFIPLNDFFIELIFFVLLIFKTYFFPSLNLIILLLFCFLCLSSFFHLFLHSIKSFRFLFLYQIKYRLIHKRIYKNVFRMSVFRMLFIQHLKLTWNPFVNQTETLISSSLNLLCGLRCCWKTKKWTSHSHKLSQFWAIHSTHPHVQFTTLSLYYKLIQLILFHFHWFIAFTCPYSWVISNAK